MDSDFKSPTSFAGRYLPWLAGAGALLLYLLTLSGGFTALGWRSIVSVAGWNWQPAYMAPLHYVLTYPIHWLPAGLQIGALNSFAVVCAALSLVLLARSVSLLPHDRTRDQRQYERSEDGRLSIWAAWVPPVLAVLVCGLQRTFWENAIIETGEALDLLIFAYIVRCLLEYRIDRRDTWLNRLAIVYGLGITNNFALIGFVPLLVAALIWIKGRTFFEKRFCVRMGLLGLAGLSLYLLLPLVQFSYPYLDLDFWETLRLNLGQQKSMLLLFPRYYLVFIGLSSLLPVLFMGIKWPASFGDVSVMGNLLTNLTMHLLHAIFLAFCIFVSFDVSLSSRTLIPSAFFPMLPFYYLGALSIGYFSGYFLLVFGSAPIKAWQRPRLLRLWINRGVVAVIWIALVAVPAGLMVRNLPQLRATAGDSLRRFGTNAAEQLKSLAPKGAVVLSDNRYQLYATYGALKQQGEIAKYALLDTGALQFPAYQRYLQEAYPRLWPKLSTNLPPDTILDSFTLIQLVYYLSQSNALFYLHPSFGYYFEKFYCEPCNLLTRLESYPTNMVEPPAISEAVLKQNDQFWQEFQAGPLRPLAQGLKFFRDRKDPNDALLLAGKLYSRALNSFGVELQKAGSLDKAAEYFTAALRYNPDNPAALINQDFNKVLRAGAREMPVLSEAAQKKLALYGHNIEAVLRDNGPIDEPNLCYHLADVFANGRNSQNYRQAALLLRRVMQFKPQDLDARLGLISLYNKMRLFDLAQKSIEEVRAHPGTNGLNLLAEMDLLQSEANVFIGRNESATAEKLLRAAQEKYPTNVVPFALHVQLYINRGDLTNALEVLEKQMKLQPQEPSPLVNWARIKILQTEYTNAIPYLDRALKLRPGDRMALANRAIANLKTGQLNAAEGDYNELLSQMQKPTYPLAYGLHEIAWKKKDRREARKWGELFLKIAPAGSPEIQSIQEHLEQLKKGVF